MNTDTYIQDMYRVVDSMDGAGLAAMMTALYRYHFQLYSRWMVSL